MAPLQLSHFEHQHVQPRVQSDVWRHVQIRDKALACYGFKAYIPSPMITDEIKELVHAEPFRPIRIVLTDRQAFTVVHTDYVMVSPDRQTVLMYDEHNRFKIINAQQIKLVEPVELSASGSAS